MNTIATPKCGFTDSEGNFFETEDEAKCSSFAYLIFKEVNEGQFSNIYSGDVRNIIKHLWEYYDIIPKPLPSPIKAKNKSSSWW